jgi:hypothetical protein
MKCPKCGAENLSWRYRCLECGEILHPEYDKMPSFENSKPAILLPFLLGLLGTVVVALFVIFAHVSLYLYCLLAVPVAGLVICWKWPRVGGVLLVLTGLTPIVMGLIGVILSPNFDTLFAIVLLILGVIALPILASGIFLIKLK